MNEEKGQQAIYDNQTSIWTTSQRRQILSRYASRYSIWQRFNFTFHKCLEVYAFVFINIYGNINFFKGVLLTQFPKLHQISRKDLLGKNYAVMSKSFPQEYNFHPITFNLPEDRKKLIKKMIEEESGDFWYAK